MSGACPVRGESVEKRLVIFGEQLFRRVEAFRRQRFAMMGLQGGDQRACELKARCTRAPFRKIARDIDEEARDYARSLKGTPEFEQSSDERKKVEMRFAT
jgi:hypothetical protein